MSIEADPALGVPYGNDLQFSGVFGKWYLYVVPEGHFCILELIWWDGGAQELTHVWIFAAKWFHRDLWSYFYSRNGGAWMWLFPLYWQQQSRWRVLLLRAWCFHASRELWGENIGVYPKHFVPWVLTPVMGKLGVMVKGGYHYFFSEQGPLLKGGGDVGGKYPCERV